MLQVNEIAHLLSEGIPFFRKFHDILTTFTVIVLYRDILVTFLIVDVFLRNAQFLFHSDFHGKSMGIPSCLPRHPESPHGLIAVDGILDGTRQDMVYSRMAVSRRRSFKENKFRTPFSFIYRAMEDIFFLPLS